MRCEPGRGLTPAAPPAGTACQWAPLYQTRATPLPDQDATSTICPISRLTSALRAALISLFLSTPVRRKTSKQSDVTTDNVSTYQPRTQPANADKPAHARPSDNSSTTNRPDSPPHTHATHTNTQKNKTNT